MEYIERFTELGGVEKKIMIKENILLLLGRQANFESINMYIPLIDSYIEVLILLSKSKILLNLRKGCLKQCL